MLHVMIRSSQAVIILCQLLLTSPHKWQAKANTRQMRRAQKAGAYLAVGDGIMNAHRNELLADDLGQLGCLH